MNLKNNIRAPSHINGTEIFIRYIGKAAVIVNVLLSFDCACIFPPCAVTIDFAIDKPIP